IGLVPLTVAPILDHAVAEWAPEAQPPLSSLAPLPWLSITGLALVLGAAILMARRAPRLDTGPTWDCGYAAPSARMQYTASSFAASIVRLFGWALRPSVHAVRLQAPFPAAARFESHVPDTVLDRGILPVLSVISRGLVWFRWV